MLPQELKLPNEPGPGAKAGPLMRLRLAKPLQVAVRQHLADALKAHRMHHPVVLPAPHMGRVNMRQHRHCQPPRLMQPVFVEHLKRSGTINYLFATSHHSLAGAGSLAQAARQLGQAQSVCETRCCHAGIAKVTKQCLLPGRAP